MLIFLFLLTVSALKSFANAAFTGIVRYDVLNTVWVNKFYSSSTTVFGTSVTTMTLWIYNNNTADLNVDFTDVLPTTLVASGPIAVSPGSCGTPINGVTSISAASFVLNSGSGMRTVFCVSFYLFFSQVCNYTVIVSGVIAPVATTNNFTVNVASGGSASYGPVGLYVMSPPTIFKSYDVDSIANGASAKLTFFITNANDVAFTGATFLDNLGALGLNVNAPYVPVLTGGGFCPNITANATHLTLPSSTIPARTTCSYFLTVTGVAVSPLAGTINTISLSTTNGGTGVSNNATL